MKLATLWYSAGVWSQELPELDSEHTWVVVFGAPRFDDHSEPLRALAARYPQSHVVGCSTAGEIAQTRVWDESLSVAVVQFEKTRVRRARAALARAEDSRGAGNALAEQLRGDGLRAVFVLSRGTEVNGSELVRGLDERLPAEVVVTGGLAGDGPRFERSWVLEGERVDPAGVVAIGLYGEALRVSHGSKGGWDTFGPERVVTRSEGNVLYELDGRPALALYKEYLGERASGLPGSALLFPLALRTASGDSVVRTVLGVDEAAQSMTFAGDIPTGAYAKLMRANFDRLILGAQEAASLALTEGHVGPTLSLAISCVGRRLVLGERSEEETEAALEALPPGTRQIGFYSYGELSPHASGRCDLHNQTMTLTVVSEAT
jgi:hypothetical protein